ncbi:MAG: DUF2232 domain-containing protein [Deltaproteobacteria bacterium]|nr:DUF2232 domain-containing protein [Deltaproteobacteria bacterium]MBI2975307.1 DUF2232 domain-containing protein [Deltaproteobacteria bacterium]
MIKHVLIAAVITALLFGSGVLLFAVPVPIFFLFSISERKAAWVTTGLVFGSFLAAHYFGLIGLPDVAYLGYFLCVSVILGAGVLKRLSLLKLASMAIVLPWFAAWALFLILHWFNAGLLGSVNNYLQLTLDQTLQMQETMSALNATQINYVKENAGEIINFALWMMPVATLLFGALVVSVTLLLTRAFAKKAGGLRYFKNISEQKFPFWPVWLTIISGMAYFANIYSIQNQYVKFAALNGIVAAAGIYFVQGCFVIGYWLKEKKSPFLRLVVYGLIVAFLQVVGIGIIALGLSDQWIDFRKKRLSQTTI